MHVSNKRTQRVCNHGLPMPLQKIQEKLSQMSYELQLIFQDARESTENETRRPPEEKVAAHFSGFLLESVAVSAEEMLWRCRPDRRLPTSAAGGGGGSCPSYSALRHRLKPCSPGRQPLI